jgi:predicted ATPase
MRSEPRGSIVLQRLMLRYFKSFRSADIPLGPLTLVVGTNASGKSNIRDALRVLHGSGLGYTFAEILGEKYGPGGILQWRGIRGGAREAAFQGAEGFSLRIEFESARDLADLPPILRPSPLTYGFTIDVSDTRSGPRVVSEVLHTPGAYFFDSHPPNDWPEQRGEHQIRVRHSKGGYVRGSGDRPGKVSEFASSRSVLTQFLERPERQGAKGPLREACSETLARLQSLRFLDLDPEAMRVPSQPGQHILGDRGENLSSVLQAICEDESRKQTLLDWLRALTPMDAVDFEFIPDFSGKVLVHLVESNGHKISALSASDGTLRFLALVAVLLSPDTGRIFFFEELDTGLHPTRLHLLIQLIQQACRNRGVQVIGTTHNPALLAFLDEQARKDALLVYRTESGPDSRIRRIADLPDIESILARQDLGQLHASGWLETAAEFSEPDDAGEGEGP